MNACTQTVRAITRVLRPSVATLVLVMLTIPPASAGLAAGLAGSAAQPADEANTPVEGLPQEAGSGRFLRGVPNIEDNVVPNIGLPPGRYRAFASQLSRYPPKAVGYRVEYNRRFSNVYPVVLIVPNVASYVDAMSAWLPTDRFPILIDDGTAGARRDIARFVRAYRESSRSPIRVLRWSTADAREITDPKAEVERALARIIQANVPSVNAAVYAEATKAAGFRASGVVVTDPDHPTWIGVLPLVVAHHQVPAWVDTPDRFNAPANEATILNLARQIEAELEATGETWAKEGDAIEGVTLLLNTAPMFRGSDGELYATTDRIGRLAESPSRRWGWASQFFAETEAKAAYRVMSNLFSHDRRAWLFDGYPDESPWNQYAMASAREVLTAPKWSDVAVDKAPSGGRLQFLARGHAPLLAELIMVTTKGLRNTFELTPGVGRPGDLPILQHPSAVYFVHSFSAAEPWGAHTIAARWFDRGAFAYVGAIDEPTLGGFSTPRQVADLLNFTSPWGAAVRQRGARPWKIAVFGDPLWTPGPAQLTSRKPWPIPGATEVKAEFEQAAREGNYAEAVRLLHMLGRDDDAARLIDAALADDPKAMTPELARWAVWVYFHTARPDDTVNAYGALAEPDANARAFRDLLWHAARKRLIADPDAEMLSLLRGHLRQDQLLADAEDLMRPYARVLGAPAAEAMLLDIRDQVPAEASKARVDQLIEQIPR